MKTTPKSAGDIAASHRDLASRWTSSLATTGFTPIVNGFLDHYGDLGITSGEAMFLVHLISYKWTNGMPFPSFTAIAEKMGVTATAVRSYARHLEQRGLLKRIERPGRTTTFDLTPLFLQLEDQVAKKRHE